MILIDVLIPRIDESFDFEVDEDITLDDFVKKATDIVESVRNVRFRSKNFGLFSFKKGDFINKTESFCAQGVTTGDRFALI